ncbi:MAG TPA: hypothetical protein VKB38_10970 [Terracidiphilus sp.]|nr:hypothetical protein [Terracidiphilus sp.]
MNVFDEKRADLEQHEFMMGRERGRLAVALDMLTDSLILVGQHGVYCTSSRNPSKPALDLQAVLAGMEGAKSLIQSVMEELRARRAAGYGDIKDSPGAKNPGSGPLPDS